jgi:hypothetical protein
VDRLHAFAGIPVAYRWIRRKDFGNVEYRLRDPDCGVHSILLATGNAGDR